MRDRQTIPPFAQHRDRDDAFDLFAEFARFADRVHHLAQHLCIFGLFAGALLIFALKLLDFALRDGFELRA